MGNYYILNSGKEHPSFIDKEIAKIRRISIVTIFIWGILLRY